MSAMDEIRALVREAVLHRTGMLDLSRPQPARDACTRAYCTTVDRLVARLDAMDRRGALTGGGR
jgi:hypothetical protein